MLDRVPTRKAAGVLPLPLDVSIITLIFFPGAQSLIESHLFCDSTNISGLPHAVGVPMCIIRKSGSIHHVIPDTLPVFLRDLYQRLIDDIHTLHESLPFDGLGKCRISRAWSFWSIIRRWGTENNTVCFLL